MLTADRGMVVSVIDLVVWHFWVLFETNWISCFRGGRACF